MKTIRTISITLVIVSALTSCYYDQVIEIDKPIEVGEMSFSADIVPIFNQSCNASGCHNGSVAPNLMPASAYSSLINGGYINTNDPERSELYQWMKGNRTLPMPLSGPNATYNAKILAWIKQGALNN
ncbi:MAG TPA: hypothetical protein PLV21_03645 [Cyclobacteriaceae bacterium]|nr:hypothetical protein [Cyclobacteriaceae bacterium]HRJ80952.1 hypothetical protein [Cyclobacteriaceae bacterium]